MGLAAAPTQAQIGQWLAALRERLGQKQFEAGAALGVNAAQISKWEIGLQRMSAESLLALLIHLVGREALLKLSPTLGPEWTSLISGENVNQSTTLRVAEQAPSYRRPLPASAMVKVTPAVKSGQKKRRA